MDQNNLDSIPNSILTLEDLSVIQAAIHVCNLINVKKKIEDFLDEHHPSWRWQHDELLQGLYLSNLLENISEAFLKELRLPEVLKSRILDKGLEFAERIHDWILHLICDLKLDSRYIEKVYFTPYGEIDEDQIFKSLWMNFTSDRSRFDDRIGNLHYLACLFYQEEYIINNLDEIKNEIHTIIPLEVNDDAVFTIMKFLIYATDQAEEWKKDESSTAISRKFFSLPNVVFLDFCIRLGFYNPFIYFWDHLKESDKSLYLQFMSGCNHLMLYLNGENLKVNYVAENLYKIVIFLTGKMSTTQVDKFILRFYSHMVFEKSICLKKFFILFTHKFLPRLSKISENYNLISDVFSEKSFLSNVFHVFEKPLLKSVICHEVYENRKDYVLSFGKTKYRELILGNKLGCLNEFIDLFLKTEDEKIQFKVRYNFLQDCVNLGKWKEIDDILTWMQTLSTTDKRNIIEEQLKYAEIDNVLTWTQTERRTIFEEHFKNPEKDNILTWRRLGLSETEKHSILQEKIKKLTQKLLKWFAGTDTEPLINNCKDPSSVMDLTRDVIYKLWFSLENDSVANISSEILKCVFGTENEIINFKQTKLAKDEIGVVRFFCDTKLEMKKEVRVNFCRIDEFFKFCSSEEKIEDVKKLIADDVETWIKNYGVSVGRFDIIVPLLDWIYGSENENCEMLKKYFENHSDLENYYGSLK